MSRWSIAEWVGPTPNRTVGGMVESRGLVLHIMQGSYDGSIAWGKNPASSVSFHFATRADGHLGQLVDTADAAWTQANGNGHWISVENEGYSGNPLTPGQVEACAQLYAEGVRVYGWPLQTTDSPNGFGLGWHGMGGTAWGGHFDCLPLDITEVLTPSGWLGLAAVDRDTPIASFAADSGVVSFDRPVDIVEPYEADTISVGGFEMTPTHRLYVHRSDHPTRKVLPAADIGKSRTNWLVPCFGEVATEGAGVGADLMRLLVWVQADGHYENDGGRLPILHFHVSKARKVERITAILDRLGVAFKKAERTDGTTSIRVRDRDWLQANVMRWLPTKRWEPWILQCDGAEFAALDEEIVLADGSCGRTNQRFYFSASRVNADLIQALYVTHGRAASIYGAEKQWIVNLHTRRKALALRDSFKPARTDVLVGCLTTVNDTILIRQNGRVMIVGNCPGEPIKAQRGLILARAQELLGGDVTAQENWEFGIVGPGKDHAEQAQVFLSYANAYAYGAMNAANAAVAKLDEVLALLKQGTGGGGLTFDQTVEAARQGANLAEDS